MYPNTHSCLTHNQKSQLGHILPCVRASLLFRVILYFLYYHFSMSGFWWPMMLMWRTVLFAIVVLPSISLAPSARGLPPQQLGERASPSSVAWGNGRVLSLRATAPPLAQAPPPPYRGESVSQREASLAVCLISVKYHYNNPYYSTHFCVLRFLTNTTL